MDEIVYEVEAIHFGLYSEDDLVRMSVCNVSSAKLTGEKNENGTYNTYGTVYDPKMGVLENGKTCETCNKDVWNCCGHFGHIELNQCIIHPLYYKNVINFLKCFCINCNKALITEDQIKLNNLSKYKGAKRFEAILKKLEKVDICQHCLYPQPEIKFSPADSMLSMVYRKKKEKFVTIFSVDEIKKLFDNISPDDISLLGFNPKFVHPKNLILTVFPVIPPACRPYVMTDGNICDDDLTNQLVEIIKTNNLLDPKNPTVLSDSDRRKYIQALKFKILTFFNNCLSPETLVRKWSGEVCRADAIKTGDKLIGDDGSPRTVTRVCSGRDTMYRVEQSNGDTYIVNSNHVLTLRLKESRVIKWSYGNNNKKGCWWFRYYDPVLKQIKTEIVDVELTQKVDEQFNFKEISALRDKVPPVDVFDIKLGDYIAMPQHIQKCFVGCKLPTPVNWPLNNRYSIDPYILGSWLAIGTNDGKSISNPPPAVLERWKSWLKMQDMTLLIEFIFGDFITYSIGTKWTLMSLFRKQKTFSDLVNRYKLVNNKHIPDIYLYNHSDVRNTILAGFIDSVGYFDTNDPKVCHAPITSPVVKIDIQNLALSLGCAVRSSSTGLDIYLHHSEQLPVRCKRYKLIKKALAVKFSNLSELTITKLETSDYVGFTVDGNNRFLLSDYTITHNSGGKAKHTINGRPIKGLKERLTGKNGVIRTNLMGKRVNQSARTVIGPDPTLRMGEIAIPYEMADILTVPVRVASHNFDFIQRLVNDGKANYVTTNNGKTSINLKNAIFSRGTYLNHGDVIIRQMKDGSTQEITVLDGNMILQKGDKLKRNGEIVHDIKYPSKRVYPLKIGDIVDRKLINGDIVLLNRQPTLHKGSMQAMKVIIRPGKTIRLNLAVTKSFNADQ